ncbi:hypothetical protein HCN44_000918 [Aphidius gifuensis]|uniref:Uncharacterized protein n=1 Tax=Aphidius gifuensis TaxID=684658 RepID=A0A834XNB4_APHGI|nr:keratin, type I cytoskeletal 10-like isoform X4 [Aphidius gifuensis]KAF7988345.1 hypothetical protein HCN44_000918 [Aphidius gifuensis]
MMRFTTTIFMAMCLIALVSSNPLPENEGLQSKVLDRLVMVESDNDTAQRSKRTIGILRQLFPQVSKNINPETENQVQQEANNEAAGSENNEVRVQFEDSANEALEPLAPLDDVEVSEDDNRNKRFLSFGGNNGGGAGGGSGSGGGSGNFLFDIIRLVAGSGSAGTSSGGGGGAGAASASAGSDSQAKGSDATQEAVPGPVTRLLVIANRGISNLLQDLILRLAATSERIVNFKARLITSII